MTAGQDHPPVGPDPGDRLGSFLDRLLLDLLAEDDLATAVDDRQGHALLLVAVEEFRQ